MLRSFIIYLPQCNWQSSSKVKEFLPDYPRLTEIWSKWPLICSKCSTKLVLIKTGGGAIKVTLTRDRFASELIPMEGRSVKQLPRVVTLKKHKDY